MAEQPSGTVADALLEPAATTVSGMVAAPLAGWSGLIDLLASQDPKTAADTVKRVQQSLTYQPRTDQGNAGLAGLGAVMGPVNHALEYPGKTVGNVSPATGALTTAALSMAAPPMFRRTRAYHGSPHTFDKFDINAIGSGEGAQTYGHGLYFSENPDVAVDYRDKLGGSSFEVNEKPLNNLPGTARDYLRAHGGNLTNAIDEIENHGIPMWTKLADKTLSVAERRPMNVKLINLYDAREALQRLQNEGAQVQVKPNGKLYTVEIPHDEHLLDWDRPLSEQPHVMQAMQKINPDSLAEYLDEKNANLGELSGQEAYQVLKRAHMDDSIPVHPDEFMRSMRPDEGASRFLQTNGIPGIRYLDRFSRAADEGDQTRNYVIFHHDDVDIKHREAHGGLVAFARGGYVTAPPRPSPLSMAVDCWFPSMRRVG